MNLTKIDAKISKNLNEVNDLFKEIRFKKIEKKGEFELILTEIAIPKSIELSKMGLYFFELKLDNKITNREEWLQWTDDFKNYWAKPKKKKWRETKIAYTN